MTPDSPKGPEIEALRERVAEHFRVQWGYAEMNEWLKRCARDAVDAVRPELERLTAEVDQLTSRLESSDNLMREFQRVAEAFRSEKASALAEVSRLREQLAAQQQMWAPVEPTDESARLADALRFVGVVDPDDDCMSVFDTIGEGIKHWVPVDAIALRLLEHMAGVSSSEVEAPAQHKVEVKPQGGGWWKAKCAECDLANYTRRRFEAEDWKDQHEADTLRPKLATGGLIEAGTLGLRDESGPPGFVIPRGSEGRPSGSERLAPRPASPMAFVREFHEAFGLPIHDRTRTLNKLRADLIREEAREAADAIETKSRTAWAKELADLAIVTYGAALTMGVDLDEAVRLVHASNMSKLGDDGKPVMREDGKVLKGPNYVPPDMSSALLQDAAQAARSEATPEALAAHAKVMADQHRQLADFIESHSPSPSLPKEGEDTHG